MEKTAIYPGTFDPITYGHVDIIERASKIFDEVIIGVAKETYKECLFSLTERIELAREATKHLPNVIIESFTGLVVDYVRKRNSKVMIRGLRAVSDFEYELQIALANRTLSEEIETVFLIPQSKYLYLSSSLVKQIISTGGSIKEYVPETIREKMELKYKTKVKYELQEDCS
ncbi:MAG TPA: pantetheine-phosphate adenylyltransferase [Candidatus Cloacimonetes bacterium]|nr:pantetheine-phosphate adenylyltransferase [Candidatus Cloacimonadota bacterium]HEX37790.1 pantetheine-phosphate adenylyltransferase [Candidatus Cloacimonadota bacterium]